MKTHLILAENWASMRQAAKDAQDFWAILNVQVTTERKDVDVSSEFIYETKKSNTVLNRDVTKSLKPAFIYGLSPNPTHDCVGILLDKEKALEETSLRGQQSTIGGKQVIEAYCLDNNEKLYGFQRNSYVTIHELGHALANHHGVEDTLHSFLKGKPKTRETLEAYKRLLLGRCVKNALGLLPRAYEASQSLVAASGGSIRITEGYRSPERQNELYKQRPKVTNAKAWESMHQYRMAFDVVFRKEGYNATDAQWKELAVSAKKLGLDWGGDWKGFIDKPHFEMVFGKTLKDFQRGNIDWSKYWTQPKPVFVRDLYLGVAGEDVRELQRYLNSHGFLVATFGPGSTGNETDYYGPATRAAVARFQRAKNITPAEGYFGAKTRLYLSTYG